jgi:hypothetical protein
MYYHVYLFFCIRLYLLLCIIMYIFFAIYCMMYTFSYTETRFKRVNNSQLINTWLYELSKIRISLNVRQNMLGEDVKEITLHSLKFR